MVPDIFLFHQHLRYQILHHRDKFQYQLLNDISQEPINLQHADPHTHIHIQIKSIEEQNDGNKTNAHQSRRCIILVYNFVFNAYSPTS